MSKDYSHLLVKSDAGEKIGTMRIMIRSTQTGGAFSAMTALIEPYQLLVPHTHENEDQGVYVIEGELEFEVGGEGGTRFTAKAGDYVVKPRKVSHGFWNKTSTTVRYIELSGGGGFENFVDSTAEDTMKAALQADVRYGVKFHYDRIPQLLKDNNLTSVAGLEMPTEGKAAPWVK